MKEYDGKKVTFMCTSKCNTNCEHCYVSYKGQRNPDELLNIIKKLKNKYKIMLNGAEVLTDLRYLKCYKELNQQWILSNGLALLNQNVINEIKENNVKSVSMSYHFGIHNEISKVKTDTIGNIIKKLRESDIEYRFLTTITSKNYQLIEEMCRISCEMGARGIMFTNFIRQGNGKNLDKSLIMNQEQLNSFFEYLKKVSS